MQHGHQCLAGSGGEYQAGGQTDAGGYQPWSLGKPSFPEPIHAGPCQHADRQKEKSRDFFRVAEIVDETGEPMDMFTEGFGLIDSLTAGMGRNAPRVWEIDYAANSVDRRRLNLDKNPDQRDELWKSVFWYEGVGLRGIYGSRHDPKTAKAFDGDIVSQFHPEDIVLPGNTDEYLDFNNDYTRNVDGERVFIHRRALFECLDKVSEQNSEAISKNAPGKPGYDEKFGSIKTLGEEVKEILNYFENKTDRSKSEINIEVDDLQMKKLLLKTLRNPYTWGNMFSFNDWETVSRMRQGHTLRSTQVTRKSGRT